MRIWCSKKNEKIFREAFGPDAEIIAVDSESDDWQIDTEVETNDDDTGEEK